MKPGSVPMPLYSVQALVISCILGAHYHTGNLSHPLLWGFCSRFDMLSANIGLNKNQIPFFSLASQTCYVQHQ
ncbi:MAG TPA: hypothetical protein DD656_01915 [Alphaproteobacteria bacterium]|nr:hypothetical protein [Alphaproteobacteria bacterium]